MKKMTPKQARVAWVKALRSEKYHQAQGCLARRNPSRHWSYCCLGVACEIYQELGGSLETKTVGVAYLERSYEGSTSFLPYVVRSWLGLADEQGALKVDIELRNGKIIGSLAEANDDGGMTFKQIADLIEKEEVAIVR